MPRGRAGRTAGENWEAQRLRILAMIAVRTAATRDPAHLHARSCETCEARGGREKRSPTHVCCTNLTYKLSNIILGGTSLNVFIQEMLVTLKGNRCFSTVVFFFSFPAPSMEVSTAREKHEDEPLKKKKRFLYWYLYLERKTSVDPPAPRTQYQNSRFKFHSEA